MDSLPSEVVELILASSQLKLKDILNFGETCKHFHQLVRHSSYIWRRKYQQDYPKCMKLFDNDFNKWYDEIVYVLDVRRRTRKLLECMSPRLYSRIEISDCELPEWVLMMRETSRTRHYMVLELTSILLDDSPIKCINVVPIDTPGNKTLQFYASKILRFIQQQHLSVLWEEYNGLLVKDQLLEKGATLIALWSQPTSKFDWEDIAKQLDELANEVIKEVEKQYPQHPLLTTSSDVFLDWKLHMLDDNQWNIVECRQIMNCLISVMFVRHNFIGCYNAYYMPENSWIDQVLLRKEGLPITLAVIFESVARRLGINCKPYPFPTHFMLQFTEGKVNENGETYYIDVFNRGNIIRKGSCSAAHGFSMATPHGNIQIATPNQVMERMANNLEVSHRRHKAYTLTHLRCILELIYTVNPQNMQIILTLAHFYMKHRIDTKPLQNFLLSDKFKFRESEHCMRIIQMLNNYDVHNRPDYCGTKRQLITPKVRPKDLRYAVGMVMIHLNCPAVIYDWDVTCMMNCADDRLTIINLQCGIKQPFYRLIDQNGSYYYAAQESLTVSTVMLEIFCEELGKHFSHFFETHYVPNAEKESEYPEDANVRLMFHLEMM